MLALAKSSSPDSIMESAANRSNAKTPPAHNRHDNHQRELEGVRVLDIHRSGLAVHPPISQPIRWLQPDSVMNPQPDAFEATLAPGALHTRWLLL